MDDTELYAAERQPPEPVQLFEDNSLAGGGGEVKRAMSMLRMGRRPADDVDHDDQDAAAKRAMGMLRMGRSSGDAYTTDVVRRAMGMLRMGRSFPDRRRAASMLRMGRAMGMLRMGRPSAADTATGDHDKRAMSMLRMG